MATIRKGKRIKAAAAVAILALTSTAPAEVSGPARVIDGDTLEIAAQRIRLYGIDAPEVRQSCRKDEATWPCGLEAKTALRAMVGGRDVVCKGLDRDRYGRVVAVCFAEGRDINAAMVRQGWALAYRRYSMDYVAEEDAARADRAGLWAGRFVLPWEWRRGKRLEP